MNFYKGRILRRPERLDDKIFDLYMGLSPIGQRIALFTAGAIVVFIFWFFIVFSYAIVG